MGIRYLRLLWAVGITLLSLVGERTAAQKIEIGASVGGLNYKGDIAPDFNFRFFRPGGSLFFRYNVSRSVTFRAEGLYGGIKGDDKYSKDPFQQARNLSFRTRISEVNLVTEYNFLDYVNRRSALNWTPYVFGGIGFMGFKPTPQTSPYSRKGWVLPFGVGVKYQIRRPWNVGLEVGTRKTFTDYLDNLGSEVLSANKLDQGDPSRKDLYYYVGFSVSYTFYRIVCPE